MPLKSWSEIESLPSYAGLTQDQQQEVRQTYLDALGARAETRGPQLPPPSADRMLPAELDQRVEQQRALTGEKDEAQGLLSPKAVMVGRVTGRLKPHPETGELVPTSEMGQPRSLSGRIGPAFMQGLRSSPLARWAGMAPPAPETEEPLPGWRGQVQQGARMLGGVAVPAIAAAAGTAVAPEVVGPLIAPSVFGGEASLGEYQREKAAGEPTQPGKILKAGGKTAALIGAAGGAGKLAEAALPASMPVAQAVGRTAAEAETFGVGGEALRSHETGEPFNPQRAQEQVPAMAAMFGLLGLARASAAGRRVAPSTVADEGAPSEEPGTGAGSTPPVVEAEYVEEPTPAQPEPQRLIPGGVRRDVPALPMPEEGAPRRVEPTGPTVTPPAPGSPEELEGALRAYNRMRATGGEAAPEGTPGTPITSLQGQTFGATPEEVPFEQDPRAMAAYARLREQAGPFEVPPPVPPETAPAVSAPVPEGGPLPTPQPPPPEAAEAIPARTAAIPEAPPEGGPPKGKGNAPAETGVLRLGPPEPPPPGYPLTIREASKVHPILDANGNRIGRLMVTPLGRGGLHVNDIHLGDIPTTEYDTRLDRPLGVSGVRQLLLELRRQYPETRTISGLRATGAQQGNRLRSVDIPGAPGAPARVQRVTIQAYQDALAELQDRIQSGTKAKGEPLAPGMVDSLTRQAAGYEGRLRQLGVEPSSPPAGEESPPEQVVAAPERAEPASIPAQPAETAGTLPATTAAGEESPGETPETAILRQPKDRSGERGSFSLRPKQKPVAPSVARVLSHIAEPPPTGLARLRLPTMDDLHWLYTRVVDDLHPIRQAVQETQGTRQMPNVSEDPYVLARLNRGWFGKVDHFIERGPFDFRTLKPEGTPGLAQILAPFRDDLHNLDAYLTAQRALEMRSQGLESGVPEADARQAIATLSRDPKYAKAAQQLDAYQEALLRYLRDSGMVTPEGYQAMRDLNRAYVPFYREMDAMLAAQGQGGGRTFANIVQPVKTMTGSTRQIVSPTESILRNTYAFLNAAERNRVGQAVVKLGPAPGLIEPVAKSGPDTVTVREGGRPAYYKLDPELHRAVMALDRESMNLLTRMLAMPARWLREGATLTPDFMARNFTRDQMTMFVQTKYGFVPAVNFAKGIFHALKRDDLYWQFQRSGAARSMLVSMDRPELRKALADVLGGKTLVSDVIQPLKNPMHLLRALSELIEEGTRLGEFAKGVKKEGTGAEGLSRAAFSAREGTVDFARVGSRTQAANAIIAFWNANVQGTDRMIRAFRDNPLRTSIRVAAGIALPSALLWAANHDDERVKALPQWQKDLFWIIPTKEHLWRIQKPFELGILFGSGVERALDFAASQDPKIAKDFLLDFGGALMPNLTPTIAAPLAENYANRSLFTGRPIVPRSMEDLEPVEQATPYTSETAKAVSRGAAKVGEKLGVDLGYSPAKLDNLVRGYAGGTGQLGTEILDRMLESAQGASRPPVPTPRLEDQPGIRAFLVNPSQQTGPVDELYTRLQRGTQAENTLRFKTRQGDEDSAIRYGDAHAREIGEAHALLPQAKALARLRQLRDEAYASRTMTPDQKRAQIDGLQREMSALAQDALQALDRMKEAR